MKSLFVGTLGGGEIINLLFGYSRFYSNANFGLLNPQKRKRCCNSTLGFGCNFRSAYWFYYLFD